MDYEKAYKDLMRDIDIAIDGQNNGEIKVVLQNIKERNIESEDERIRKSLVVYFRKFNPKNMWDGTFSFGDVLSYLERQKDKVVKFDHDREQKPAKGDGPFDEDKFLEGELAAFLQNYDKEYDDDAAVSDVAIHFYELGKKMKQKLLEQ